MHTATAPKVMLRVSSVHLWAFELFQLVINGCAFDSILSDAKFNGGNCMAPHAREKHQKGTFCCFVFEEEVQGP